MKKKKNMMRTRNCRLLIPFVAEKENWNSEEIEIYNENNGGTGVSAEISLSLHV
jgi:hypothetical protein